MNDHRFDAIARSLATGPSSRRGMLGMALGGVLSILGLAGARTSAAAGAEAANAFGCLAVGRKCFGHDAACCSGRCSGKRPKKGQPDRRRCAAHNTGGCTAGQDFCTGPDVPCGTGGACYRTTGDASFCALNGGTAPPSSTCTVCTTDASCETQGFGPGAACLVCASCTAVSGNSGTACAGPAA
jgi:hypothetical protein